MQRLAFVLASTLALGGTALAADLTTPQTVPAPTPAGDFDIAFGGGIASDYNFRGISQSDRGPSARAYFEAKYWWLYAGIAAYGVDLPTRPSAEVDLYGGIRPVVGPFTFDFGYIFYYYPNEVQYLVAGVPFTPANSDFWEVYGKVSWTVNEQITLGANLFYSPSWVNSGADGTYASLTASIALPNNFSISGEIGRYWLGTNDLYLGGLDLPDYTYWNVGLTYTHENTLKFDVRYHGTDLNRSECFLLTSDPRGVNDGTGRSRWCGDAFIATISFDTSLSALRR